MVLLAPASDLALEIVARLAVAGQPARGEIDLVQRGDHAVHLVVDRAALGGAHVGQSLVPEHAALHVLHEVESATDDGFVLAQRNHFGYWHVCTGQALHHRVFALDGVGGGQQLGHRPGLGAHHVAVRGRDELVGGIGLPALEKLGLQRAGKAGDMLRSPGGERVGVEGVLAAYRARANELVVGWHGGQFKNESGWRASTNGLQVVCGSFRAC